MKLTDKEILEALNQGLLIKSKQIEANQVVYMTQTQQKTIVCGEKSDCGLINEEYLVVDMNMLESDDWEVIN